MSGDGEASRQYGSAPVWSPCPARQTLADHQSTDGCSICGAQDVRALAQVYTAEAILALVAIMRGHGRGREQIHAQARAYAASELLDRGHGKLAQAHSNSEMLY